MAKKFLSIEVGSNQIKLAHGQRKKNTFIIDHLSSAETPRDSYFDGKIINKESLMQAVYELIKRSGFKTKSTVITINSTAVIVREIVLPSVKTKELDSMIRFEITHVLPIELNQYVIEYKIIGEVIEDSVKKNRILVVAVPKTITDSFYEFITELRLEALAMDIGTTALSNLFEANNLKINDNLVNGEDYAVLDIGDRTINCNVFSTNKLAFSKIITMGSNEIDIRLSEVRGISVTEASKLKQEIHVETNHNVQEIVDKWCADITRVYQFYENRFNRKISRVFIYGSGAKLFGLEAYMSHRLGLPTEIIDKLSSVKVKKGADIEPFEYLNTIGAIPLIR